MADGSLFSVGHSTHSIEDFIALLKGHRIDVVADVRSTPFSKFNPQFNKDHLAGALQKAGIKYAFFGNELGARVDDPSCYVEGKVQYARLATRPEFQNAIARLIKGAVECRIALMCAEKEPLDCHRTILVSEALKKAGCEVSHIHADGSLETHGDTLKRLMKNTGLHTDLLRSEDEALQSALAKREAQIAYQKNTETVEKHTKSR